MKIQIGFLAMWREGQNWNAYYALQNTMEGAVFLGSISLGAIVDNPDRKEAFMQMMCDIVADLIEAKTGERPTWGAAVTATEHEKSGEA